MGLFLFDLQASAKIQFYCLVCGELSCLHKSGAFDLC